MNPHLQRALILLQQHRPDLAEAEFRLALAADPDDGFTHAMLADCLCENEERLAEATDEARRAILLTPDMPRSHAVMARVMFQRNRLAEARAAIDEAIRLDPHNAHFFSLLAAIRYALRDWPGTLEAAEAGLEADAEHVGCNNFRAMALVQLGRRAEAGATIGGTLALDPENAFSHANQGWALLHQGDATKAKEHFSEALRLEPGMDYARRGMIEAMKARNPIYALMLRYFLWMNRLSQRSQWIIILGLLIGQNVLLTLADQNPALKPFVMPIMIAYVAFALMTWLAVPLFNLLLFFNRFGRHALSRDQKIEALTVGLMVGVALAALLVTGALAWAGSDLWALALLAAAYFGLLTLPVSGIFKVPRGWPRHAMMAYAGGLALLGLAVIPAAILGAGSVPGNLFVFGCVLSWLPINGLMMARVRR